MAPLPNDQQLRLLELLRERYPTIVAAHTEMISLHAILALPKGTDHYISDIHGAYEQFDHVLRTASGAVRRKISQTFGEELSAAEQVDLAMLVYYPEIKLRLVLESIDDPQAWLGTTIARLARVARTSARKYTRSKVRKRLTLGLAYVLEELLTESDAERDQKEQYYHSIVRSIVDLGEGERLVVTLAELIKRLVVDRLYILGDIYDRGNAAEKVVDRLMAYHSVAIQWGNHDISWMAAAAGCDALIANVLRLSLRYCNLETLTDGYNISLRRLAGFADETYAGEVGSEFMPKSEHAVEGYSAATIARMHKAITIIQLKLEAAIIARHPEYEMDDRLLLERIDLDAGTVALLDGTFQLNDTDFPTLEPGARSLLSPAEAELVNDLNRQFRLSARLGEHIRFLYSYGNMFEVRDGNLKFHGCLPVDEQGAFVRVPIGNQVLAGPELLERYEQLSREAFFTRDPQARQDGQDAMWYLWCGRYSPLFGRLRMTTFERYFVDDPRTHEEPKGPYYMLRDSERFCRQVLEAFGGDPEHGHIINGHTPIRVRKGERPVMANGRLIVIDGGMSEAYQPVTGIAGYTLIINSHEMLLAAHEASASAEEMVRRGHDLTPNTVRLETFDRRVLIAATDTGHALRGQLEDLQTLVDAYRQGIMVENARAGEAAGARQYRTPRSAEIEPSSAPDTYI